MKAEVKSITTTVFIPETLNSNRGGKDMFCPFTKEGCTRTCALFDDENNVCTLFLLAKELEHMNMQIDGKNQENEKDDD